MSSLGIINYVKPVLNFMACYIHREIAENKRKVSNVPMDKVQIIFTVDGELYII